MSPPRVSEQFRNALNLSNTSREFEEVVKKWPKAAGNLGKLKRERGRALESFRFACFPINILMQDLKKNVNGQNWKYVKGVLCQC